MLEEVVYLVESVTVLEGTFDERFLELRRSSSRPRCSLTSVFRSRAHASPSSPTGGPATVISVTSASSKEGSRMPLQFERDVAKGIEG